MVWDQCIINIIIKYYYFDSFNLIYWTEAELNEVNDDWIELRMNQMTVGIIITIIINKLNWFWLTLYSNKNNNY